MAQAREDAARDLAELRAAFEAQIAAAEDARAALQARAERAEAELQRALAGRDQAPERPPGTTPTPGTTPPAPSGNLAKSNYERRTSRSGAAQAATSATRSPTISAAEWRVRNSEALNTYIMFLGGQGMPAARIRW